MLTLTLYHTVPVNKLPQNQGEVVVVFDHVVDPRLHMTEVHIKDLLQVHKVDSP